MKLSSIYSSPDSKLLMISPISHMQEEFKWEEVQEKGYQNCQGRLRAMPLLSLTEKKLRGDRIAFYKYPQRKGNIRE